MNNVWPANINSTVKVPRIMTEDLHNSMFNQGTLRRKKMTAETKNTIEERVKTPTRFDLLVEELQNASREEFTGSIKVNYSQGSIGRVEKFEEILKK